MKTSSNAYRILKAIFRLLDPQYQFDLRGNNLFASRDDQKTFQYLKSAGYVRKIDNNRYSVTDLARINFLRELVSVRKSDGRLRIVMFDVPETLKRNRNFFRRHLKELGFSMKQQSVWVSGLPCEDLVREVVRYHGLGKFVALVVGEDVLLK